MPVKLAIAKTAEQTDSVYKLRHKVFCEENDKFSQTQDARLFDRFDAYPTTANIIAIHGDDVVGSLRVTIDSELGVPADNYYDFRSHLPSDSNLLGLGMLCVSKEFRNSKVVLSMIKMGGYYAIEHDISHAIGPINPGIVKLVKRIGFDIVGNEIIAPHTGLPILPAILDLDNMKSFYAAFAEKNELVT